MAGDDPLYLWALERRRSTAVAAGSVRLAPLEYRSCVNCSMRRTLMVLVNARYTANHDARTGSCGCRGRLLPGRGSARWET